MAVTRTFSIIKPDATRRNLTGAVTKMLEDAGLRVVASKRIHMTREQAEGFYAVHKERPFFGELVDFMISGPVVVQVLEGENAMQANRDIMGATSFVPHGLAGSGDDAAQPILLSQGSDAPNLARNLLIADGEWREAATSYDRAFYLFDETSLEAARLAWKLLAGRDGVERHYWAKQDGRWVEKA